MTRDRPSGSDLARLTRGTLVWTLRFGAAWAIGWAVALGLALVAFLVLVLLAT